MNKAEVEAALQFFSCSLSCGDNLKKGSLFTTRYDFIVGNTLHDSNMDRLDSWITTLNLTKFTTQHLTVPY
jgi:hypothetical protein